MARRGGFTLIEISIVLVIIGLVVGGVLVGRELIGTASLRAQVSQIEKFNTALNTFRGKYNCMAGDCKDAANFGFAARGTLAGQGDGNSVIEGYCCGATYGTASSMGETILLWSDLSIAGLIDGSFTSASATVVEPWCQGSCLDRFFPKAKMGNGNYIYVYSGRCCWSQNGINYFGISAITFVNAWVYTAPGLTPLQAYALDTKVDDGLPQSGRVLAQHLDGDIANYGGPTEPAGGGAQGAVGTAAADGTTGLTCYDNGNVGGVQ